MRLIAAILLTTLVIWTANSATVSRPAKTCGQTTYAAEASLGCTTIKSSEVDADLAALVTGVNAIESANIVDGTIVTADIATGGVATADILDGTVSTTDITDGTITTTDISGSAGILGTELAVGATIKTVATGNCEAGLSTSTTETTYAQIAISTSGGYVQVQPQCFVTLTSDGTLGTWTFKWYENVGAGDVLVTTATVTTPGIASVYSILMPPLFDSTPTSGSHTYKLKLTTSVAAPNVFSTTTATPGTIVAYELR